MGPVLMIPVGVAIACQGGGLLLFGLIWTFANLYVCIWSIFGKGLLEGDYYRFGLAGFKRRIKLPPRPRALVFVDDFLSGKGTCTGIVCVTADGQRRVQLPGTGNISEQTYERWIAAIEAAQE